VEAALQGQLTTSKSGRTWLPGAVLLTRRDSVTKGLLRDYFKTVCVCVCVLLCFINPILGNRYGPRVIPFQGTWDGRILILHLNYVAGYTGPLLFLFERTHNYYVHNKGLVLWQLRRLGRSKVRSASLVRVLRDGKIFFVTWVPRSAKTLTSNNLSKATLFGFAWQALVTSAWQALVFLEKKEGKSENRRA